MAWTEPKVAWTDKFRMPTEGELRLALTKGLQSVLDAARGQLGELEGVSETVSWQGVPWRWSFVYHLGEIEAGQRGFAYVIPDPVRLQVCVPLTAEQVQTLPIKKMKKSIREGVVFARSVNGVWWPTWDVPTTGALDEVMELITRKHKSVLAGQAEPARA